MPSLCRHIIASPLRLSALLCLCAASLCYAIAVPAFAMFGISQLSHCSVLRCEAVLCPRCALLCCAFALFFSALQCYALATLGDAMPFRCNADLLRALAHLQAVLSRVHRLADNPALHVFDFQRFPSRFRHILFSPLSDNGRDISAGAHRPQAARLPLRLQIRLPAAPA